MTREEFTPIFIELMIRKIPEWTPEESTEAFMINSMLENIKRHREPIQELLIDKQKRRGRF